MRDKMYELRYMDAVLDRFNNLSLYKRPIEPDIGYILMWENCYTKGRENRLNSLGWLFANEYYRVILEGDGL